MNRLSPLWEQDDREFTRLVDVNLRGMVNVIRHFVPPMVARKKGVIVNLSSGWGRSVSPEVAPYCASKWAVEGLTKALAEELPKGMAAIPLNPGVIDTDMLRQCWADGARAPPESRGLGEGRRAFHPRARPEAQRPVAQRRRIRRRLAPRMRYPRAMACQRTPDCQGRRAGVPCSKVRGRRKAKAADRLDRHLGTRCAGEAHVPDIAAEQGGQAADVIAGRESLRCRQVDIVVGEQRCRCTKDRHSRIGWKKKDQILGPASTWRKLPIRLDTPLTL